MDATVVNSDAHTWLRALSRFGAQGARISKQDWRSSALGPLRDWPHALRTALNLCLNSTQPVLIWWGDELIQLHNDAFADLMGTQTPAVLGLPAHQTWREHWPLLGPHTEAVLHRGEATTIKDLPLLLNHHGHPQACRYSLSFTPLHNDKGVIKGIYISLTDITRACINERRLALLHRLNQGRRQTATLKQLCQAALLNLGEDIQDIPFALFYLYDRRTRHAEHLATLGLEGRSVHPPSQYYGHTSGTTNPWEVAIGRAVDSGQAVKVPGLNFREDEKDFPSAATGVDEAYVIPSVLTREEALHGVLVIGLPPYRPMDRDYEAFLQLVGAQISATATQALAHEPRQYRSHEQLKLVLTSIQDAFIITDTELRITYVNGSAARTLGLDKDSLLGTRLLTHVHELDRALFEHAVSELGKGKGTQQFEFFCGVSQTWTETRMYAADSGYTLLFTDITQRKRSEALLKDNLALFRTLADAVPLLIWMSDPQGSHVFFNHMWLDFTGLPLDRLTGTAWLRFVHPDDHALCVATQTKAAHTRKPYRVEFRLRRHDQVYRWMLNQGAPRYNLGGEFLGFVGGCIDISERKKAEQLIARSHEELERLVQARTAQLHDAQRIAHFGSWEWSLASNQLSWSEELFRIYGLDPGSFTPHYTKFLECVHPDDRARITEIIRTVVAKGGDFAFEERIVRPDGEVRILSTKGKAVHDESGRIVLLRGVCLDVTEQRLAQRALAESEQRYRRIVDTANEGIWLSDQEGRIVFANQRMAEMLQDTAENLWGKSINEFVGDGRTDNVDNVFHNISSPALSRDVRLRRRDGSHLWCSVNTSPVWDENQGLRSTLAMVSDISDRKHLEIALLTIAQGVSSSADDRFFVAMVEYLARALKADLAFIAKPSADKAGHMQTLVYWHDGKLRDNIEVRLETPFSATTDQQTLTPTVDFLKSLSVSTYIGVPIQDAKGLTHAAIAVMYRQPYCVNELAEAMLRIFASRAGAELQRSASEQQLQHLARSLRQLSHRLLESHETERRVIAGELHDEIGQSLTAAKISIQTAVRFGIPQASKQVLDGALKAVEKVLQQVRDLSLDLRPSILDDLGLAEALRWYLDRQVVLGRFSGELIVTQRLPDLPKVTQTVCFRIAQEAINNVVRHAHASHVRLSVKADADALHLHIDDDGQGFNVAEQRERARLGGSFGLLGMEERAVLAGGHLEIQSQSGIGTRVLAVLPLHQENTRHESAAGNSSNDDGNPRDITR